MHYANTPMQYTAIFHGCKNVHFQMKMFNIVLIFAQNIDCEAVLTSTHNLCFGAKIIKKSIPLLTPVLLYKSGVCVSGVFVTRTCFRDGMDLFFRPISGI